MRDIEPLPSRDNGPCDIALKVVNCQPDGLYSIILSIATLPMPGCGIARIFDEGLARDGRLQISRRDGPGCTAQIVGLRAHRLAGSTTLACLGW